MLSTLGNIFSKWSQQLLFLFKVTMKVIPRHKITQHQKERKTFNGLHFSPVRLATTGHGVPHTCPCAWIDALHDDKGPLLQCGHGQVTIIRHRLQEAAIARPNWVAHVQNSCLITSYLGKQIENTWLSLKALGYRRKAERRGDKKGILKSCRWVAAVIKRRHPIIQLRIDPPQVANSTFMMNKSSALQYDALKLCHSVKPGMTINWQ